MQLFQIKFIDGSYLQTNADSFAEIEGKYGFESISSIVKLERVVI